jgi:hypothetical protein
MGFSPASMASVILGLSRLDKAGRSEEAPPMLHSVQGLAAPETPYEAPAPAMRICRGVIRLLDGLGFAALQEFPLKARRRADVIALHASGEIVIVEVKSGRADFQSDRKWPDYLEFCDRFFFAVEPDFPRDILPLDCGLIVADAHGGEIVRPAPQGRLNGNRRRVLTLEIAISANRRLARQLDPDAFGDLVR